MRSALINARVFTGEEWIEEASVLIENDRIQYVGRNTEFITGVDQTRDLENGCLVPGFIDVQVNGGGGALLNKETSLEGIRTIARAHRKYGTTGMLPTLITDDQGVMEKAIAAVKEALSQQEPGVLGIHLEGPYLNQSRKGVHQEEKIRSMEEGATVLLSSLKQGITLVTLAPEKSAPGTIKELVQAGVIVAAGHTAGGYEDYQQAFAEGLSCFTHLFNAMTPMNSREPGAVGAALEHKDSWCGLIVDGFHVHPATLKVAIRAKQPGKMMLVTDAMPTVGSKIDYFELYGQKIYSRDGRCITDDGVLAGAHLDMATAVRNTVEMLDIPRAEALRMASLYPAQFLGLGKEYGMIKEGYKASMVLLDDRGYVRDSWVEGRDMAADGFSE
ncbi:MAG: N-acetylglucosamine-6-phosphate deacetylase [Halopseudomonas aestusnigri]